MPNKFKTILPVLLGLVVLLIVLLVVLPNLKSKPGPVDNEFPQQKPVLSYPSELPEIPVYPEAVFVSQNREDDPDTGSRYKITWTSSKPLPVIMDWYLTEIKNKGWSVDLAPEDPNNENLQMLTVKKQNLELNFSLIKGGGGSNQIIADFQTPFGLDRDDPNYVKK
jgi:hypothetical protein